MRGAKTCRFAATAVAAMAVVEILDNQKKNDEMCTLVRIVDVCFRHLV